MTRSMRAPAIYQKGMSDAMVEWGWWWVRKQIQRAERLGVDAMCLTRWERAKAAGAAGQHAWKLTAFPWGWVAFVAAAWLCWANTTPGLYRRALFRAAGQLGVGWRHLEEA